MSSDTREQKRDDNGGGAGSWRLSRVLILFLIAFAVLYAADRVWKRVAGDAPPTVAVTPRVEPPAEPIRAEVRRNGNTIAIDVGGLDTSVSIEGDPAGVDSLEICIRDGVQSLASEAPSAADPDRRRGWGPFSRLGEKREMMRRVNQVVQACLAGSSSHLPEIPAEP